MKSFLLLAAGLCLNITAVFSQTSIRMTVNEESKPCRRMMEQTCLQVKKEGASEWELFYDNIKGFNFEPGNRYEIVVIQTPRPEPVPQDLSKYTYRLDKIISKTPVNSISGQADMVPQAQQWKVVSLNGTQLNTEEIYFAFSEDGTQISGKSGCNGFSTPVSYNKKKTKITTKSGIGTLIACSEELTKLESEFLASVNNKTFKLSERDGKKIWKRKRKEVIVLEAFVPVKQVWMDDPKGEKTAWDYFNGQELRLIQLNGKTVKESKAQLIFDTQAGKFTGNNGCNQLFGNFTTNVNAISFTNVGSTKMFCTDESVAATEREVMAILGSEGLTVDFADQVMNIYDASGKIVLMLGISK